MLMLLVFSFSTLVTTIIYASLVRGCTVKVEVSKVDSVVVSGRLVLVYHGPLKTVDVGVAEVFMIPGSFMVIDLAAQPLNNIVVDYDCRNNMLTLRNLLVEGLAVAGVNIYSSIMRLRNLTLTNVTLDATNFMLHVPAQALKHALIEFGDRRVGVVGVSIDLRMLGCDEEGRLLIDGVKHSIRASALYVRVDGTVVVDMGELKSKANTVILLSGASTIVSSLVAAAYILLRGYEFR